MRKLKVRKINDLIQTANWQGVKLVFELKWDSRTHILFLFQLHQSACRIVVPQPGIEPAPPTVEVWSLNHGTTCEVPGTHILNLLSLKFSSVVWAAQSLLTSPSHKIPWPLHMDYTRIFWACLLLPFDVHILWALESWDVALHISAPSQERWRVYRVNTLQVPIDLFCKNYTVEERRGLGFIFQR